MSEDNMTSTARWVQPPLVARCTNVQVRVAYACASPVAHSYAAGVRPMLAASTLMAGAAGIWSYVKRSI